MPYTLFLWDYRVGFNPEQAEREALSAPSLPRRYDLTLGERAFYLPAPSYPRSFLGQRGANSKQAAFMGPRLPPHMIKVIEAGQVRAPNYSGFWCGVGFFLSFVFPSTLQGFFTALVLEPELFKQWLIPNCAAMPLCYFTLPAQLSKALRAVLLRQFK